MGVEVIDGRTVGVAVASDKLVPGIVVMIQRVATVVNTRMMTKANSTGKRFKERCISSVSLLGLHSYENGRAKR